MQFLAFIIRIATFVSDTYAARIQSAWSPRILRGPSAFEGDRGHSAVVWVNAEVALLICTHLLFPKLVEFLWLMWLGILPGLLLTSGMPAWRSL